MSDGGFDLNQLLAQAEAMQQQLANAQAEQATKSLTGTAGGGKVTVEITGAGEFRRITIAPDVVDPDDVEMLEELVLAAVRDAANQVSALQAGAMENLQVPGMGGLGGLLGGGS
ncbi:MAG: YbaB/EbfC family nucleoid-associated protein [Acidimicrobiales bacterium]